jgi:hypothetical protein
MRNRLLYAVTLLTLGLSAGAATALPCAGFTDVEDTSSFCPNVEWLKNRAVTLGCSSATLYCPTDPVTRLSMAVFMNRLGKALTPVSLHKGFWYATSPGVSVSPTGAMYCVTDDLPPATFPRTARFIGSVWATPSSGPSWLAGWWKYSTDAGATWSFVGTPYVTQFFGRDWADYGQVAGFPVLAPAMDVAVGSTYRFGVHVSAMGGPYTFSSFGCEVDVTINSSNPATSPFDAD